VDSRLRGNDMTFDGTKDLQRSHANLDILVTSHEGVKARLRAGYVQRPMIVTSKQVEPAHYPQKKQQPY